jgi:cell division protein FtsZ
MEVNYEEVSHEKIDDFIITAAVKDIDVNYEEVNAKKDQFELTFDLHLDKGQKKTGEININEIEVIGHIEVKPIEKKEETVYFNLAEYTQLEDKLINAKKPEVEVKEAPVEEELRMNVRTETVPISEIEVVDAKEVSPLHLTISELQKRSEDRKEKMKQFNYKFSNNVKQNIDEIEREPAYKRMGVEFDKTGSSSDTNQSKTTLSVDGNDELQLRANNSFLHDNVD